MTQYFRDYYYYYYYGSRLTSDAAFGYADADLLEVGRGSMYIKGK